MLVLLCLPLFLGFAADAQVQTRCSATDIAVTAVITDGNDTDGRMDLAGDCAALLGLKDTLRGTGSLNWANSLSMASWDGISVTGSRVTSVKLTNKSLDGTIPTTFPSSVIQLHLNENQLTGNVPDLSSLTSLTELFLQQNKLDGTITPSHFPTSLVDFQLHENDFSGSIPDLRNLISLRSLSLADNRMTGTVDDTHVPTTVTVIALQGNQLSGQIPTFASHSALRSLYLQRNQLTGNIPDLSGTNIRNLTINNNRLAGELDASHLPGTLEHLQAQGNRLTGSLPNLSGLTNLAVLVLSDNEFSGMIDASHFPEETLRDLYLHRNKLTGSLPSMNAFTKLRYFYVHGNQLSGALPTTWDALTSLQQLHLSHNSFTGAIPSGLDDLDALVHLSLCSTNLDSSATLPTDLETRRTAGTLTLFKCIWVDDAEAAEGSAIQFTVDYNIFPLKGSSSVQLSYETEDITATDGSDYTGMSSGSLTIPAIGMNDSSNSATFSVPTTADSVAELDETFIVRLGDLPDAVAGRSSAVGTILGTLGCSAQNMIFSENRLRILENGGVATYCVRLMTAPSGGNTTVTIHGEVHIGVGSQNAATVSPTMLTFTASNYQTPQQVTVTGVDVPNRHENRSLRLRHAASGGGYSGNLGNLHSRPRVAVDDAPEVEAWWYFKGNGRVQRPHTVTSTPGLTPWQNAAPGDRLSYVVRLSNRPEPDGTVTVTATVPSDKQNLVGLSLTENGAPQNSVTVEFKDRSPGAGTGCSNWLGLEQHKYLDSNGIERNVRGGGKSESYDGTADTPWECWCMIYVVRKPASRNIDDTCADITHTATGGGVRKVTVDTIRAHILNPGRNRRGSSGQASQCRNLTGNTLPDPQGSSAQAAPAPTEKISNLQVTEVDATSVSVTWDAVANATSYDVSWSAESSDSLNASAGAESVTGTSATIQHDASVPMTLTVTVTPEYIDKNGVTQQLNELAGTATLAVGPSGQRLDSGGGTNGGNGGSIDSGEGAVDLPVPVSHWRFEYDAVDWVGSSHGTEKGGVAFEANEDGEGVDDHALSLDGSDDYVDLSTHVSDFPLGDSTRSVTGWFKADAGNQRQTFFTYGPNVAGKRFSIAADRTQVLVAVSGHAWGVNGLNLSEGWHHIAVTYAGGDSDDILIYLDGELQSASTLVGSPKRLDTQTGPAAIGRNVGGTKHYTGLIDDVRLYDVALSAEQVLALFEEHPQTPLVEDNLDEPEPSEQSIEADDEEADDVEVDLPDPVSHWSFDNDAVDGAGSSHGTVSGGAAFVANEDGEGVGSHALSLDGSNDYVDLDLHVSNFPLGDSARSITGWFRADTGNQGQSFFSYGPNVAGKRFSIAADRTQALVGVSGHGWGVNGLELQEGWHHVAVTYAGGKSDAVLIYLDGELQSASTLVGSPKRLNTGTGPAAIGQNVGGTKHYAGSIDDVRLYDVALSAEQVRALFDEHPQL